MASNALCPAAIITPNPIPLVRVLFRLLTYPDAAFIVDVNPLSAADNIAFTLNDSATPSLSFLEQLSDSGEAISLTLLPILKLLQLAVKIEEVRESPVNRLRLSFSGFLFCLNGKVKESLPVLMQALV